jgi:hypothetical protein
VKDRAKYYLRLKYASNSPGTLQDGNLYTEYNMRSDSSLVPYFWEETEYNTFYYSPSITIASYEKLKVLVCGFQLEDGNIPTAWHISPEEDIYYMSQQVDEKVSAVEQTAQDAKTAAEEASGKYDTLDGKIDSVQTNIEAKLKELEVIVGTQNKNTNHWTGTANFAKLADKKQIVYWLPTNVEKDTSDPEAQQSTAVDLELTYSNNTTTGRIPVYYGGTSRLTTHYKAGNAIRLVYRQNVLIGETRYTGWWCDANYNTTGSDTYDRL